jgi:hypothetical protein
MAGTVKLCVPELAPVGELVARGEDVPCGELVERAETVAVTEGLAECACAGEVAGVADVCDDPGVASRAAELPEAGAEATVEADPPAAHAVRPAPPMTTAMITAGTRHILMLLPLQHVTRCYRR